MFPSPGHKKLSGEGCIHCLKQTGKPAPSPVIDAAISVRKVTQVALGRWSQTFPQAGPPGEGREHIQWQGKPRPRRGSGYRALRICCAHTKKEGFFLSGHSHYSLSFLATTQSPLQVQANSSRQPSLACAATVAPRAKGRFSRPPPPGSHRS